LKTFDYEKHTAYNGRLGVSRENLRQKNKEKFYQETQKEILKKKVEKKLFLPKI